MIFTNKKFTVARKINKFTNNYKIPFAERRKNIKLVVEKAAGTRVRRNNEAVYVPYNSREIKRWFESSIIWS